MESCDFRFSLIRGPDVDTDEWDILCSCTHFPLLLAPLNVFSGLAQNGYVSGCDSSYEVERKECVLFGDCMQFFSFWFCYKMRRDCSKLKIAFLSGKCWHLLQIHFFKDLGSLGFLFIIMANVSEQSLYVKCILRQFTYTTSLGLSCPLKGLVGSNILHILQMWTA